MKFSGRSTVEEIAHVTEDICRLSESMEVMMAANSALTRRDYQKLGDLGFSEQHVAQLIEKTSCGKPGFPDYAIRNNRSNIRTLTKHLEQLKCSATADGGQ